MKRLTVTIPKKQASAYPILIGNHLLTNPKTWLPDMTQYDDIVIITDSRVKRYYGDAFAKCLLGHGFSVKLFSFPAGEKSKQQKTKQALEEKMLRAHCHRNTLCLALGGGVVGDLAGFLAATYMRGISYIQIPTTLLAMVDSSVGGKTAIDTVFGKNLIGAFWQPIRVIIDLYCLKSLPKKQLINGLIEALKMFLTSDAKNFDAAELGLDKILENETFALSEVIYQAVAIKANVVEKDEKENNLRMILNFGHTIGHAIEMLSQYKMPHGYAVGYGILVEAKISEMLGFLTHENFIRIQSVFARLGIVGKALKKIEIDDLIKKTKLDKKAKAGEVCYVLLKGIGHVYKKENKYAHPVPDNTVKQAFLELVMNSPTLKISHARK
jgi:3-dehydroquinate synthase